MPNKSKATGFEIPREGSCRPPKPSKKYTLSNRAVTVSVDERGRLIELSNHQTGTNLIAFREAAEGWRLVIPSGPHTIDFVCASTQRCPRITMAEDGMTRRLTLEYSTLQVGRCRQNIHARFSFELFADQPVIRTWVEIDNQSPCRIDEVEFPVIGGLGGFKASGRQKVGRLLEISRFSVHAVLHGDVLAQGLPVTGRESHHFVRLHETAMWEDYKLGRTALDISGDQEGLTAGYLTATPHDFAFTMERHPKGVPNAPVHEYPQGIPRWLRLWGTHLPCLEAGQKWKSEPVSLYVHFGDWHAGATFVRNHLFPELTVVQPPRAIPKLELADTPAWMRDFVGWTEILGKLYTGEVFYDFKKCADRVVADASVTGLDLLFYYGHTQLGAEGADLDQSPATDLGGEKGFARMLKRLRTHGIRVMLLDHLHRFINQDIPEYGKLKLERYAVRDSRQGLVESRWWKETVLSCRRLEGPTPRWLEMCPACPEWQEIYLCHVRQMIERGVDGLELDCFGCFDCCYSPDHGHPVGAPLWREKIAFMRRVREMAKRLNPDFIFIGETMAPESRAVCDGWYNNRFPDENGRVFRFLFPEYREQAVLVGNYAYDAVNKALMLGVGVETEIWGLRKTTLDACPELARYIGEVNALRRRFGDVLIRGTFRDTLGARVKGEGGEVLHGVMDGGASGRGVVVRNPARTKVSVEIRMDSPVGAPLILARPGLPDKVIRRSPVRLTLDGYGAAVLLAMPAFSAWGRKGG